MARATKSFVVALLTAIVSVNPNAAVTQSNSAPYRYATVSGTENGAAATSFFLTGINDKAYSIENDGALWDLSTTPFTASSGYNFTGTTGCLFSLGTGINNIGQVTGYRIVNNMPVGFICSPDGTLVTFTGSLIASSTYTGGINNAGQVVGYYSDPNTTPVVHGFLYSNGAITKLDYPNSASPTGTYTTTATRPTGINNSGEIVGYYTAEVTPVGGGDQTSQDLPFSYINGAYKPLPSFPVQGSTFVQTLPQGVNDSGVVVGNYNGLDANNNTLPFQGYLYDPNSSSPWATVNYPGAKSTCAYGINNTGQIVGTYSSSTTCLGGTVGFVANPVTATLVDPVPLSSDYKSLLASGTATITPRCTPSENTDCNLLATQGRIVQGVSADGVAQVVIRIAANSVGEQFNLMLADTTETGISFTDDDGGLAAIGTDPLKAGVQQTLSVNAVETNGGSGPSQPMAFAIYRAPVDFVRAQASTTAAVSSPNSYVLRASANATATSGDAGLTSRTVQLQFSAPDTTGFAGSKAISITRPPVVLVHGFAVDAKLTWNEFTPLSDDKKVFSVFLVDYGKKLYVQNGNVFEPTTGINIQKTSPEIDQSVIFQQARLSHLGFTYSTPIVAGQVEKIIKDYASGNNIQRELVAAVSADIVAHSMGGLEIRYWSTLKEFYNPYNFNNGYVHKLITLGAPHFGTPQAVLSLLDRSSCSRNLAAKHGRLSFLSATLGPLSAVIDGAAGELQGDGIGNNMSIPLKTISLHAANIPIATIGGDVESIEGQLGSASASPSASPSGAAYVHNHCPNDPLAARYTTESFDTVFDPDIASTPPSEITATSPSGKSHSDGAVPLTSALMASADSVSKCSADQCFSGYAHGSGTASLFSSFFINTNTNYLVDDTQVISLRVEDLLNTSIQAQGIWQ